MSNIQKQHKISPAIAWLTIQKFIIFYCPLDREHTKHREGAFFLVSPNGIFAFPLSVYAKFKKVKLTAGKLHFTPQAETQMYTHPRRSAHCRPREQTYQSDRRPRCGRCCCWSRRCSRCGGPPRPAGPWQRSCRPRRRWSGAGQQQGARSGQGPSSRR